MHSGTLYLRTYALTYSQVRNGALYLLTYTLTYSQVHNGALYLKQHDYFDNVDWEALIHGKLEAPFKPSPLPCEPDEDFEFEPIDKIAPLWPILGEGVRE